MKMVRAFAKLALVLMMLIGTMFASSSSHRILGIFPQSSKSHNIVFQALMQGLAKRGHRVDVISHYPREKPIENYNGIVSLVGTQNASSNDVTVSEAVHEIGADVTRIIAFRCGNDLCEYMGLERVQKIVKSPPKDPPYDLVITEASGTNCYLGFGHVLKVPVVAVSSGLERPWTSYFIGNDDNLAYVPNALYDSGTTRTNFYERLTNVVVYHYETFKFHRFTYEAQTESMRRYLDPDIPDVREIERNVALTLVNTHPILSGVKPITPALIQIGGIHIEMNDESLPEDLKKWMDESTAGVVYFSLGSAVLFESFPEDQLKQMYASFEKISPVGVLARVANSTALPAGLPKNVKLMPWIPQQPVLAHPNTKVFITHGGLCGVQEALYHWIPMIGIPLFGDQFRNIEGFVAKKMAVKIDFEELSETSLDSALQALLRESTYKEKATHYSRLFRDQPISTMNNAAFWIEYVIRNGPDVIRSPALELSFVQLALLDVYGVLLLIVGLFVFIVFSLMRIVIKQLKRRFVGLKMVQAH